MSCPEMFADPSVGTAFGLAFAIITTYAALVGLVAWAFKRYVQHGSYSHDA